MNILPKKRWHVRTRENIARVRKDEQEAQTEAEDKKQRVLKAEKEARTALLRERASAKYGIPQRTLKAEERPSEHSEIRKDGHVNFFEELEEGKIVTTKTNAETELEEKEKREKYEKQIGYLTYLGQDTVETTGNVPWYDKVPSRYLSNNDSQEEKNSKTKSLQDPLTAIRKLIPSETITLKKTVTESSKGKSSLLEYHSIHKRKLKKKKHKKKAKKRRKRRSSCSSESTTCSESEEEAGEKFKSKRNLEQLRAERLKREKEERERTEKLLDRLLGKDVKEPKEEPKTPILQQKYNSQYNPELAKQNFATSSKNK